MTFALKEQQAMEYRYLGKSNQDIAKVIGVHKETVDGWFKERGKLFEEYSKWSAVLNEKRAVRVEKLSYIIDEEVLLITKAIARNLNRKTLFGTKKPLMKNGSPVLDENGNVVYFFEQFNPTVADFYKMWKLLRVTQGKPTNITEKVCPACKNKTKRLF